MGSDAPKVNEDVPKVAVAPAAVPIAPGVTLHTCFQVVPFCKVKVNVSYNKVIVRKHIPFGKDRNLPL